LKEYLFLLFYLQGKRLTVANATKISIGQPILRVAIAQLATYKIYLAPVIFRLHFVKKLFSVIKLFVKIVNESFFKHFIVYDLVTVCFHYANATHKIPGTSAVYWVA
jgi:hypothetical protein